jgi:tetratricopeptide (TPR) repeat protein
LKCLEKTPGKRYATALELAEDLRRFERGEPVHARRIGALGRSWKWARRHPWQTISAAIVLFAVASFMGLTYRHNLQLQAEIGRTEAKAAEARRNYQEARSAIQAMLARLTDRRLNGVPRLVELRREQREDALAFYDRILRQDDSSDPVVRLDTARALSEATVLLHVLGRNDEAEKSVRRALSLIKGLRAERPDDLEYMQRHVECLFRLAAYVGTNAERAGQAPPGEMIDANRESVDLAKRIAQAEPNVPAYQELLALCHHNLGDAFLSLGQNENALSHYQEAIAIRERIDESSLPGVTQRIGEALVNVGLMLWGKKDYPQAEEKLRRAEKIFVEKGNVDVALAQLYATWSGMLHTWGRLDDAITRANAGLERIESYLGAEPNDANARGVLLKLHGNRGYALAKQGKHTDSVKDWTRVVELWDPPVPAEYRVRLAIELLAANALDKALEQAKLVQPSSGMQGLDSYNMACIYSRTAAGVRDDRSIPADRRSELVQSHIATALKWLEAAEKTGIFSKAELQDQLKKDSDVDILRDRPEFRRLLQPSGAKP